MNTSTTAQLGAAQISSPDIVERMRARIMSHGGPAKDENGAYIGTVWPMMLEAANEIERLREAVNREIDRADLYANSRPVDAAPSLSSAATEDALEEIKGKIARAIYDVSIRWIAGNFPEDHEFLDFSQVSERDCNLHFDYAEAVLAVIPSAAQRPTDPAVEKVVLIARDVVWFDWSSNDTDAVHAIEQLRLALSELPSTDRDGK